MTREFQDGGGHSSRGIRLAVLLLFFCSGLSGLIYEVVWTRLLTLTLGNTVHAVSIVLSAFMGGLALGSFVGGRMIDRRSDPLRVYALLEIGIGVLGLCLTSVLSQTGPAYVWIHGVLAGQDVLLMITRYVFALVLLVVPTTLMGATLPVLGKFVVARRSAVGLGMGLLYALNTLGAAAGCCLAGFVLIGNAGVRTTVWVAAAVNLGIGAGAWILHRRVGSAGVPAAAPPAADAQPRGGAPSPVLRLLVLGAFGVSGLAALGYEVLWMRLLTSYLGNSVYAFATILTTFLIGLALGGLVVSGFVDRRKRLLTGLGLVEAGIGLYVLLSVHVFGWRFESLNTLQDPLPRWEGTVARFLTAFAVMCIPTFLMGAVFPIAARIYTTNFKRLGRSVGQLYSWNTVGAILGAATTGFVLMPAVGVERSLLVLLSLNIGIGIVLCAADPAVSLRRRLVLPAAMIVLGVLGVAKAPRDVFRRMHRPTSPDARIIHYEEGTLGTVVVEEAGRHRRLRIDHLDVAGTDTVYLSSHKSLGHLPMLLHPAPRSVFVLGFGGGGTCYAVSTHPEVKRIDSVELSRSIADAAPLFTRINHNVMADPRFRLEITDGRHFLLTTRRSYDVISVDLLWPQTAGAGSLYTREFYELCRRRLRDGGLMVEWLHLGFLPTEFLGTILRTVRDVFPHVSLWWTSRQKHLLFVASKAPLRVDFERLARGIGCPDVRRDLAEVGLDDPATFASYFIAADDDLAELLGAPGPVNTDDLPVVEYRLPWSSSSSLVSNMEVMVRLKQSVLPRLDHASQRQKHRVLACERSLELTLRGVIAIGKKNIELGAACLMEAIKVNPDSQDAKYWFKRYYYVKHGR